MRNILREFRQNEVRKYLENSIILDIGSSCYPISFKGITIDVRREKKPEICASTLALPICDNSIDTVTLLEVIEHFTFETQKQIVKEIQRILKLNGKIILTMPNYSLYLKLFQDIIWFCRERTTEKEYYNAKFTHAHIGKISPEHLKQLFGKEFTILNAKRLFLYDYLLIAQKQ